MKTYTSVCPYDCPDACGLVVSVDDGRVVSVAGDGGPSFYARDVVPEDGPL